MVAMLAYSLKRVALVLFGVYFFTSRWGRLIALVARAMACCSGPLA